MKIITWNINSINARLDLLLELLAEEQPDIIGLQETKCESSMFPRLEIEAMGYHICCTGQKSYNGVAILSKKMPLEVDQYDIFTGNNEKRIISATIDSIRIVNLYVVNGQDLQSEKFQYKLAWLEKVIDYIKDQASRYSQLVVMGDFNIIPEKADMSERFYPNASQEEKIFFTTKERALFKKILEVGLQDAFRLESQKEDLFSWWDYREKGFEKNHGLRIDHILISNKINSRFNECKILRSYRAKNKPSDHAPVMLTIK